MPHLIRRTGNEFRRQPRRSRVVNGSAKESQTAKSLTVEIRKILVKARFRREYAKAEAAAKAQNKGDAAKAG